NLTPDKLPKALATPLFAACDEALRAQVELLRPSWVIGVGAFAEQRARTALGVPKPTAKQASAAAPSGLRVDTILHPSPASPLANRGWAEQVDAKLTTLSILPLAPGCPGRLPRLLGALRG